MIMNYNKWFYKQHEYLKNIRDGKYGFNDTKWITINNRYQKLIDMNSELLTEQPFLVYGNNAGFDKLLDLIGRSNYTFEDLDKSMIETYKMSLQNAMSRNLVNTHAVMFHTNNMDKKNVTADKFTHYRIIEAPFNQLHFGHRDEFIRQKLHDMHITKTDYFMDIKTFNTSEIVKILGFSIICSANGRFSNDCKVAIDDKGFKFKVGWPWSYDVDFIVYKLDHGEMFSTDISINGMFNSTIPYSKLNINMNNFKGMKCIVNIYNKQYSKSIQTVPNFGVFTSEGLEIKNIQQETISMINTYKMTEVTLDIYGIKFLHELPNLYPAVNYYDLTESRLVYDDKYERIKNIQNNRILAVPDNNVNNLEICTPPIALDRNVNYSFNTVLDCLSLYDRMMEYHGLLLKIGESILEDSLYKFAETIMDARKMYDDLVNMKSLLIQGGLVTSLVSAEQINRFDTLLENINNLININDFSNVQSYVFDELYDINYRQTVEKIVGEFHGSKLGVFSDIRYITRNFFTTENSNRFNRPISEQCFISLRYHRDENAWLFDYPQIKHFHGIGNVFYIDENLKGDEIYKFFVLYSDTDDPVDLEIDKMNMNDILDFDQFYNEVEKHIGCVRYWDAENRIMKMSKILYNRYDDDTCAQILSKVLKRKLNGDNILKIYPSDINYEESNVTTDNIDNYDENTERGPFAINFLFYTLSMMNDNKDKLQSYFYRYLVNDKYNIRYADIDISDYLNTENSISIKYAQITTSPSRVPNGFEKPHIGMFVYYGLPLILNASNSDMFEPYRYVMNNYKTETKYNLIGDNQIDKNYYVEYDNLSDYAWSTISYHDNIKLAKLITWYVGVVYDYISDIQTNYTKTFNQSMLIESAINTITQRTLEIYSFMKLQPNVHVFNVEGCDYDVNDIETLIIGPKNGITSLGQLKSYIDATLSINHNKIKMSIITFINDYVLPTLRTAYVSFGFDNSILKRARMLYIYLKKINTPMNIYKFQKWVNNIDIHTLSILDDLNADNENYNLASDTFKTLAKSLQSYINMIPQYVDLVKTKIESLSTTFKTDILDELINYCKEVLNKQVFDLYKIDSIEFNNSTTYADRPHMVVLKLPASYASHLNPPLSTQSNVDKYIPVQPISDKVSGRFVIKELTNICEFLFFNGEKMTNIEMSVYNENGTRLGSQVVSISFIKVCSTADSVNEFDQILNCDTTELEFENNHESFEVVNNLVVNEKHADMNYEMLLDNHFTQLEHDIEYVLKPETWVQGSIDKVYVNNQLINNMITDEIGNSEQLRMFFKPVQVLHIPAGEDGSIRSIYGKYFVGQTIYLKTYDGLYVFPAKITAVDHSVNKGFVEAEVDAWNSKWIHIKDRIKMNEYLTQDIECEVIDDNIRNFLNEFNGDYYSYNQIDFHSDVMDENYDTFYKMPGDPIYVSTNADYVYTRLNWFFDDRIKNRFIDDKTKRHNFIYVGSGFVMNENDNIKINMINHDFNDLSLPEKYPILRSEPNDHAVWSEEIKTFKREQLIAKGKIESLNKQREIAEQAMHNAKYKYDKERLIISINEYDLKIQILNDLDKKLGLWIRQLETPNTWFNVRSYGAAMVYIANGRAGEFSPTYTDNIRDLVYTDDTNVWLYDWEHKEWLSPYTYEIDIEYVDSVKIDECDDYSTNRVLYSITIKPLEGFKYSKKILIYFSYNKSDVFDDIEMNDKNCTVRFKPLLSMNNEITDYSPYKNIRIRKHFDGFEKYVVSGDDIHIKRIRRSGKYTYSPTFRIHDMIIEDENGTHTWEDIDEFLIKSPFSVDTQMKFHEPIFDAIVKSDIDYFTPNTIIKLIAISNNETSSYDGNISSVMFEAITSEENNIQKLTIINSTLPNYATGDFICTVFMDDKYSCVGGVIQVSVTNSSEDIYGKEWTKIPLNHLKYYEIPNEFKIIMKQPTSGNVTITLKNNYIKDISDIIDEDNGSLLSPYGYYYDKKNMRRLPISDTRISNNKKRLIIDKLSNVDVTTIKSTYIGICRYSRANIPANGLIDLTGYIPTPLSRERYEFWINGKCILNKEDVIILSPTSIQLCNMTSLKNFEVIELIDDFDSDNDLLKDGNMYVDLNGNSFSSYRLSMLSNSNITEQNIRFVFNVNNHNKIHDYTKSIIGNPNNKDIEENILSSINFDVYDMDYTKLHNIPSINGVPLLHPDLKDIGLTEIPNNKINELFDSVWRYETLLNPLFQMTHKDFNQYDNDVKLHIKKINSDEWHGMSFDESEFFDIYTTGGINKYFTLYISKKSNGVIDDIENTVKIIPFIMTGTHVLIDKKYEGMWLHSTYDTKAMKLK